MDDTRTQQALDELADLFLSGQAPATESPDTTRSPKADPLSGPAPIRLGPKLRTAVTPRRPATLTPHNENPSPLRLHTQPEPDDGTPLASIGQAHDEADNDSALARDFDESSEPDVLEDTWPDDETTDDQDEDLAVESHPGYAVAVEAVILGNLPGLSGPWLTQYAQLLAQQEGPVAILHVDDDLIDLELVEPTNRGDQNTGNGRRFGRGVSLRMPPGGGKIDPVTVLEALLDSPDAAPGTILVHLDPQNDALGLSRAMRIEDWTLMCGADDLAIVGGFRMLKTLAQQDPGVTDKRVGLMIMGSDPKLSQESARKFQSAAENFLRAPVQLLGWQKQMVPVNLRHLGRFEDVATAWPRLAEWFDRYAATEPQPIDEPVIHEQPVKITYKSPPVVQHPTRKPEPIVEPQPTRTPEPVIREAPPRFVPRPHLRPAIHAPRPEPVAPVVEPAPTITQAPSPVAPPPAPEPQVQRQIDEPDLVELLMTGPGSIPGGIAMEARCPHQPGTQLLLDQAGRLHLLHRHNSKASGLDGLQPAMVDLLHARQWVHEHLQLLQLTQRQLKFDTDAQPVLHLFTDRADWATALAGRLGEALKLHLLQEVQVGDQRTWFCTPLN